MYLWPCDLQSFQRCIGRRKCEWSWTMNSVACTKNCAWCCSLSRDIWTWWRKFNCYMISAKSLEDAWIKFSLWSLKCGFSCPVLCVALTGAHAKLRRLAFDGWASGTWRRLVVPVMAREAAPAPRGTVHRFSWTGATLTDFFGLPATVQVIIDARKSSSFKGRFSNPGTHQVGLICLVRIPAVGFWIVSCLSS